MTLYSSYTYSHPSILVRYPHTKRIEILAKHIGSPSSWLDYGAGDGVVCEFMKDGGLIENTSVVLYEPVEEIRSQMTVTGMTVIDDMAQAKGLRFDVITACEVLEHLPLPERIKFYRHVAHHLSEDGLCLIEVPVEFGPILLLKEAGRRFLKGRDSAYRFGELTAATFGVVEDANNRFDASDERTFISPHHGFDLRRLLKELRQVGDARIVDKSPFPYLPIWLNQCVLIAFKIRSN